jgi:hypothetical protein
VPVAAQVEEAVRRHDVDGLMADRQVGGIGADESHAAVGRVAPGRAQHARRHIQADDNGFWPAPRDLDR